MDVNEEALKEQAPTEQVIGTSIEFISVKDNLPYAGHIVKAVCSDGQTRSLCKCDCEYDSCEGWFYTSPIPASITGFTVLSWRYPTQDEIN